jgi:hypothetical protein
MNLIKMIASLALTWVVTMILWTIANYNAVLAYSRQELGIIPMIAVNNSFDTWSTGALIVGAIIGAVLITKKAA